jgi:broad-specificity NMP kinase
MQKPKVYIISGTLGAGKTTVSKLLAAQLQDVALIRADLFLDDMLINSQNPSWERRLSFVWTNVIFTAKNAFDLGLSVVIDGVVEDEFPLLFESFNDYEIYYCILVANEPVLKDRLKKRGDQAMINRSLAVLRLYQADAQKQPYLLDTSHVSPAAVVHLIRGLPRVASV